MSDSCDPVDCSPSGSSVHGFLSKNNWSGLLFPTPGDLPNRGVKAASLASSASPAGGLFFATWVERAPDHVILLHLMFWRTPYCFLSWLYQFTVPPTWSLHEGSLFSMSSPAFIVSRLFWGWGACGILVLWSGIKPMPPAVEAKISNYWTTSKSPISFLIIAILTSVRCYLIMVFDLHSLIINDVEHLFIYLLAIFLGRHTCLPWKNVYADPLDSF